MKDKRLLFLAFFLLLAVLLLNYFFFGIDRSPDILVGYYIGYPLILVFSALSSIYAAKLVFEIKSKEKADVKLKMQRIFSFIAVGIFFFTLGEFNYWIYDLLGLEPYPSVADIWYLLGYVGFFTGFMYFNHLMFTQHKETRRKHIQYVLISAVLSGALFYWILSTYVVPYQEGESMLEVFFDLFYPIASNLLFVLSVAVYVYFRKYGLGKLIYFMSLAILFAFIGDFFFTYYTWNEIYGIPGILSDLAYSLSYILFFLGFYSLAKKIEKFK